MSTTDGADASLRTPTSARNPGDEPAAVPADRRTASSSAGAGEGRPALSQSTTRLADGRTLHYYGVLPEPAADRRELPAVSTSSQMRHDPILDEWVVMASHRQSRTFLPPTDQCPLCPSTPQRQTEIPASSYDVAVFENRFPSLSTGAVAPPADPRLVAPFEPARAGSGRCEVVCFTSDHQASFADLSPEHARLVIDVWAERTAAIGAIPEVEQVFCFENRGVEIGVTLGHPHGQIYGYPFLTPRSSQMLASARRYRAEHDRDLFDDVVAAERADESRTVLESEHWYAFVPRAARWPVEVHLYPKQRHLDLPELSDAERDDLAVVYLELLQRLDRLYDAPLPYIAAWHQAPVRIERDLASLHLELFSIRRSADKLKYLAGSESGMGAFITDVLPEAVAERLRSLATPTGVDHG